MKGSKLRRGVITLMTFVILAGGLTGCANTRDPQAINTIQDKDSDLSCTQIFTEYTSNTEIAAAKIKKNDDDDVQDAMVGLFVWPGLADFKNADGIEGNALLDRNIRLKNFALEKNCEGVANLPSQPVRYD
jgi:hypothetical protein